MCVTIKRSTLIALASIDRDLLKEPGRHRAFAYSTAATAALKAAAKQIVGLFLTAFCLCRHYSAPSVVKIATIIRTSAGDAGDPRTPSPAC
jgi:hypothetical protein